MICFPRDELSSSEELPQRCQSDFCLSSKLWEKRLILDLIYGTSITTKFKFEDWRVGLDYFEKGSYFTAFDLKSGYHHLDIFPEHQPFLGFSWVMPDGEPSFFMFTVLPFGLSSAPYIFTKLLRPLVKHWRSQGMRAVVYLDDGFDIESTESLSQFHSNIRRSDLAAAGFIANDDKSVWVPAKLLYGYNSTRALIGC